MVNLTIDGKPIEVPEGTSVLKAARQAGAVIPTLCDHPELTPYGGCRMCLVEVEGLRTLQPSCTLPASSNMVVKTSSERVKEARKFVLTLLFSERNHFCMYCQKSGGDCELQNCAYAEGMTHWPLPTNWKPFAVDASHPDFVLDQNRCILCRRCVRACGELVGNYTLGFEERGASSLLIADLGTPLGESTCVSCGSCVQVCPVGALIDRQSAYLGRETQVDTTSSTCIGCSVGCGINVLTRDNHLMRIDGDWADPVNGGVLCQLGRFQPLKEERERIVTPLVKKNGSLKAATWDEALSILKDKLAPLAGKNGSGIAAIASTRLSAEALSLFKQIFNEQLGSPAVYSLDDGQTARTTGAVAADLGHAYEGKLDQLKSADFVLTVGADLGKEHQVAGFFVKRNLQNGTYFAVVSLAETALDEVANAAFHIKKNSETEFANGLAAAIDNNASALAAASDKTGIPAVDFRSLAQAFAAAKQPVIVYGKVPAETVKALMTAAQKAGKLSESYSPLISIKGQANSLAGAMLAFADGFEPKNQQAAYVALGDDTFSQRFAQRLEGIPFLAVQAAYASPLTAMADVVLPVEMWAEQEGHFLSLDGRIQASHQALTPPEGVLSNTAALSALAAQLGVTPRADWKDQLLRSAAPVTISEN
ncbi:MAG TPA: molybdopterin-dependent oxidoreductase [Anaerolineaceae bacterium]|jgi:formate dehydrogenase major subunit